jgi:iron(III) transport system substrate-binding protein
MTKMIDRRRLLAAAAAGGGTLLTAPALVRAQERVVNLYSARHYDSDKKLYAEFTQATGIRVAVVEAGADALLERLRTEGANSPADVLLTVDAGRIEAAKVAGLLQPLVSPVLAGAVPAHQRDPDSHWFAVSKRARVIMYDIRNTNASELSTYEALAEAKWRGAILTRSSTNIYSQSWTGSMIAALGESKAEEWARGVAANLARPPRGGDTDQIRALAAGEGKLAISNTYYLGNLLISGTQADRELAERIGVFFPNQGDRGTHVNITAAGVARHVKHPEAARTLIEYLVSPSAQRHLAAGNSEFPVAAGAEVPPHIAKWGTFKEDQLNAGVFARNNAQALRLMDRAGWK